MSLQLWRDFFLWCTIVNYAVLLVWFVFFAFGREWIRRLHGRWFQLADAHFDGIHYAAMSGFKLLILVFNLTPYIVLCFVG